MKAILIKNILFFLNFFLEQRKMNLRKKKLPFVLKILFNIYQQRLGKE